MITAVSIEHYKSVDHVDLTPGPVTILVGPNGVGKSNLLDALRFLKDALTYDLDRAVSDRHGIDSIRQWSPSRPYHVKITVRTRVKEDHGYFSVTLGSNKGQYTIIREEGSWTKTLYVDKSDSQENSESNFLAWFISGSEEPSDKSNIKKTYSTTYNRDKDGNVEFLSIPAYLAEKRQNISVDYSDELFLRAGRSTPFALNMGLDALRKSLIDFESYSIFPNTLKRPQTPSNDTRLMSGGDNLTSIFKMLVRSRRGSNAKSEILSSLQKIMPALDNIVIQSVGGLMVPMFRVKEADGKTHDFNVSQISDGTLRALGILTALYQLNCPSVLALEEPEQTINPAVLAVLADSIKEASEKSQMIVTTHSPTLVDHFDPEQILAVEMSNGITRASPINESQKEAVKERLFSLGELMTIEGLFGK